MPKPSTSDRPHRQLSRMTIVVAQVALPLILISAWHVATRTGVLQPFFFGEPTQVFTCIWDWFVSGSIYPHLWITLVETLLAFTIGTVLGVVLGLWLGLSPTASLILDPYIIGANAMPRVILAPMFILWFGLGIWSKVALSVTIVIFVVFFNVYQGVREVSPVILNNARMLGANHRQLLRRVYIPSALSWVFASLHNSVGLAFVGAVVGEYLGSSRGIGYLILQAEGTFDISTVFAGIIVLTFFALLLDYAVTRAERKLLVWRPVAGQGKQL